MTSPTLSVNSLRSSKRIQNLKSTTAILLSGFNEQDPLIRLISHSDTNITTNRKSTDQLHRFLTKWNAGKSTTREHPDLINQLPKEAILDRCFIVRDKLDAAFHKDSIIGQTDPQVAVTENPTQDETDIEVSDTNFHLSDNDTDDEVEIIKEPRKRNTPSFPVSLSKLASSSTKLRQSTLPLQPKVPQVSPQRHHYQSEYTQHDSDTGSHTTPLSYRLPQPTMKSLFCPKRPLPTFPQNIPMEIVKCVLLTTSLA